MKINFSYDNIAKDDSFFGRADEIKKLDTIVDYSNNILIYSKRRMGKTTLIKNFLDSKKDFISVYVDIFDITSKEDFAHSLLKSLSNSIKYDLKTTIKTLTNLFKRVRVEPTIDPNTLEYSIKPVIATLSFEQMIEDFFGAILELSKKNKIIIAIDEFQQISTIKDVKLDAILRKYIQERQNTSYIFLGSKRHTLTSLFSYQAPLYELANHFELPPLKIEDIYNYSKKYLKISEEQIRYIYELSDGETKLILHILHLLYISKESIDTVLIDKSLQDILNSKDTTYRMLFDTLNNNQKLALKLVGKYGKNFYNQELLQQYRIKKQTLKSALDSLFTKELIDRQDDEYFIPDRTFELWVKTNFL